MSDENKEQKIHRLNNGSVLFIPKVDRNGEPVEQGYINSVEIGKEYGAKGIIVNAIAPGFIETDMVQDLDSDSFVKNITLVLKIKFKTI